MKTLLTTFSLFFIALMLISCEEKKPLNGSLVFIKQSIYEEAQDKPGKPILVSESKKILKLRPVFKAQVLRVKKEIAYEQEENMFVSIDSYEEKEERSYFILLAISSVFLMILANILKNKPARILAFVSGVAACLITVMSYFVCLAALAAFIVAFDYKNRKGSYIFSLVFYYLSMFLFLAIIFA